MAHNTVEIVRFVRAVHRRMAILRLVEGAGLGAMVGCVAAICVIGVLYLRGQPIQGPAMIALMTFVTLGLARALLRLPGMTAAAMEADRQLRWSDLLSTAWLIRGQETLAGRETFGSEVLWQAASRCQGVRAGSLVLHRMGARAWGSVALGVVVVWIAGLLAGTPVSSDPGAAGKKTEGGSLAQSILDDPLTNATRLPSEGDGRRAPEGRGSDENDPLRSAVNRPSNPDPAAITPERFNGTGSSDSGAGAGSATGQGAGDSKPLDPITSNSANGGGDLSRTGAGGVSTGNTGSGEAQSTGSAGSSAERRPLPPWRSDSWPRDQQAAQRVLQSGQVPDAYRALVQDYFGRR